VWLQISREKLYLLHNWGERLVLQEKMWTGARAQVLSLCAGTLLFSETSGTPFATSRLGFFPMKNADTTIFNFINLMYSGYKASFKHFNLLISLKPSKIFRHKLSS